MAWVAAGFDPDRFWRQTPRSFGIAMRGAEARIRRERVHLAEAVRAGQASGDAFETWVAAVRGIDTRLPETVLGAMLGQAFAGLPVITMDEALRRMH